MAQIDTSNNSFISWNFTDEEEYSAKILTGLQKQGIQNLISKAAHDRLALDYDPNNHQKFIQDESFLKGQIAVLTYMLDISDQMEEDLLEKARQAAGNQEQ